MRRMGGGWERGGEGASTSRHNGFSITIESGKIGG